MLSSAIVPYYLIWLEAWLEPVCNTIVTKPQGPALPTLRKPILLGVRIFKKAIS